MSSWPTDIVIDKCMECQLFTIKPITKIIVVCFGHYSSIKR